MHVWGSPCIQGEDGEDARHGVAKDALAQRPRGGGAGRLAWARGKHARIQNLCTQVHSPPARPHCETVYKNDLRGKMFTTHQREKERDWPLGHISNALQLLQNAHMLWHGRLQLRGFRMSPKVFPCLCEYCCSHYTRPQVSRSNDFKASPCCHECAHQTKGRQ